MFCGVLLREVFTSCIDEVSPGVFFFFEIRGRLEGKSSGNYDWNR